MFWAIWSSQRLMKRSFVEQDFCTSNIESVLRPPAYTPRQEFKTINFAWLFWKTLKFTARYSTTAQDWLLILPLASATVIEWGLSNYVYWNSRFYYLPARSVDLISPPSLQWGFPYNNMYQIYSPNIEKLKRIRTAAIGRLPVDTLQTVP